MPAPWKVRWYARRHFVYDGKDYAPGDEWRPIGHRNDELVMDSDTLVRREYEPPRRRGGNNDSKTSGLSGADPIRDAGNEPEQQHGRDAECVEIGRASCRERV